MITRYFLRYDGQANIEVTMEEFMAAERKAGFNGPEGRPATAGFNAPGIRGRVQMEREEPCDDGRHDPDPGLGG